MGLVTMSERDLKRIEVLTEVLVDGVPQLSSFGVAEHLARLFANYRDDGGRADPR
jgi:hypothetical protein